MKIFAVVGCSGSGKTRLLTRLIPEFRRMGVRAAVVKHCSHGIGIGGAGKDSSKYLAAGAADVGLVGPGMRVVIYKGGPEPPFESLASAWFPAADLVIVEGGRREAGLRKIEVLRRGVSEGIETPESELAAVVAELPLDVSVPVFHPDRPAELAAWLKGAE
jgi:molybdopterin-guanine dinucleotide biosynthesis protein B